MKDLIRRSEEHRQHYERWNSDRETLTQKFKETFHQCFHDAFQALGELTSAILACSDEELNIVTCEEDIPESAITTRNLFRQVRAARDAFHRLSDCSESGLRDIFSRYSQEVFVEESGFYNLEKELDAAYDNISAEYHRADEKRAEYWREYEKARDDYDDLSRKLEVYDSLVRCHVCLLVNSTQTLLKRRTGSKRFSRRTLGINTATGGGLKRRPRTPGIGCTVTCESSST